MTSDSTKPDDSDNAAERRMTIKAPANALALPAPFRLPSECQQPMEAGMTGRIIDMSSASVLEDGSLIEMKFTDEGGETQILSFAPDDFERFLSRAVQLVTGARSQKLAIGDQFAIRAVAAVAVTAQAPEGGGTVILSVRSDAGLPYHFSLSLEDAKNLQRELFRAVKSAKNQASKTRH